MINDLVCGTEVDEGATAITSVYKGKTYYRRAPGCKGAFEAEGRGRRRVHCRVHRVAETDAETLRLCIPLPVIMKREARCGAPGVGARQLSDPVAPTCGGI